LPTNRWRPRLTGQLGLIIAQPTDERGDRETPDKGDRQSPVGTSPVRVCRCRQTSRVAARCSSRTWCILPLIRRPPPTIGRLPGSRGRRQDRQIVLWRTFAIPGGRASRGHRRGRRPRGLEDVGGAFLVYRSLRTATIVYYGTGQPVANVRCREPAGEHLYTNSTLAVDARHRQDRSGISNIRETTSSINQTKSGRRCLSTDRSRFNADRAPKCWAQFFGPHGPSH